MPGFPRLPTPDAAYFVLAGLGRAVLILIAAFVLSKIANRLMRRLRKRFSAMMMQHPGATRTELDKRAATLVEIFRKVVVVAVWASAVIMALREIGFDVRPLLAGAGIAGVAIGFGAQHLVRDVISGIFILLENQIRINDVAVINGTSGLVEEINLRTTVLRSIDGAVHIFPNGTITTISNMSREFSYYVFKLRVGYDEDPDEVIAAIRNIAEEMRQDPEYRELILEPLDVMGIDQVTLGGVLIEARIKTLPVQQWKVGREMNLRIKKKFDQLGIKLM